MSTISTMLPAEKVAIRRWTKATFALVIWVGILVWWLDVFDSTFLSPNTATQMLRGLLGLAFLLSLSFLLLPCLTMIVDDWTVRMAHFTGQSTVINPPGMFLGLFAFIGYLFVAGLGAQYWSILLVKWLFGQDGEVRVWAAVLFGGLHLWLLYRLLTVIGRSVCRLVNRDETAHEHYRAGRFREALSLCNDILRDRLGTPEVFFLRGRLFLILGVADEAEADFVFLQQQDKGKAKDWDRWAAWARAIRLGREAKTKEYVDACEEVGWFEMTHGSAPAAIDWFTRVLDGDDGRAAPRMGRALVRSRLQQFTEALVDADRAVEINPHHAYYWSKRGVVRLRADLVEDGLRDFEEAVRINPSDSDIYWCRALCLRDRQEYAKACEDFSEYLRIKPDDFEALRERGCCHRMLRQANEAVADFTGCIRQRPRDAQSYVDRARARKDAADTKGAREDFLKAIELCPAWSESLTQEIPRL